MQRIISKAQFAAVMAGQTVSRTPHFALHRVAISQAFQGVQHARSTQDASLEKILDPPLFAPADCWLGVVVPKRWAKRAVTRNTIKRQIYAVSSDLSRQTPCSLPQEAHVVRLRATFDRAEFISATSDKLKIAVRAELQQLFAKAVKAAAV